MAPKKIQPKPWEGASKKHIHAFQLRPTEYEHALLKYFGETTYGESMQSIAINAIRAELEKRCKKAGIEPPQWE